MSDTAAQGFAFGAILVQLVIGLAAYLFYSYCLMVIARKTGHNDDWMAWVPIVNAYYMCVIAGKPAWWLILLFIPCVNFVIGAIVCMAIAEKRNKPSWWGILAVIPCVGIIVPPYLAFAD